MDGEGRGVAATKSVSKENSNMGVIIRAGAKIEAMTYPLTSTLPLRASFSVADAILRGFWSCIALSGECDAMTAIRKG